MRIPAKDPQASAAFYHDVFGWGVDATRADPSFEDGSGHVIGHFIPDAAVSGEAGVRPYVYVESVDERWSVSPPRAVRPSRSHTPKAISAWRLFAIQRAT
jgi:predicted enzyme related to lactoylglutathione lyase